MRRSSAGMTAPVLMSRFDWRAKGVPALAAVYRLTELRDGDELEVDGGTGTARRF